MRTKKRDGITIESGRPDVGDRSRLNLRPLSQEQSVLDIDAEASDGVLDFGMAQKDLDCPDVACRPVDHRRLCSPERVRSIFGTPQADRSDPIVNQTRILPSATVLRGDNPTRKDEVAHRAATSLKPREQAYADIGCQFRTGPADLSSSARLSRAF